MTLGGGGLFGAAFQDVFANRELVAGDTGSLVGSNVGATVEYGEPRHAGKRGGHSMWVSWQAPSSGVIRIDTDGSGFDTLLGVYRLDPGTDPPLRRLRPVGGDDDSDSDDLSAVEFSTEAGQRYEIAVDGYAGAIGTIVLNWSFRPYGKRLPVIVRVGGDRAVRLGGALVLTVDLRDTDDMELQWLKDMTPISGARSPSLVVPSFQPKDVGQYRLRIRAEDVTLYTMPAEVQVNSEGYVTVLARNKFEDSWDSGLVMNGNMPQGQAPAPVHLADVGTGLSRGYNGTQIFSTITATRDPGEPLHCGIQGGASYWFAYDPPETGTAHLDTDGSDFDTVLAVYTFDPPLTGFADLIPVACDDNSGANGVTSSLSFAAQAGRSYFVVVDGVGGANGIAHLNYVLTPAAFSPPSAPIILSPPAAAVVAVLSSASLSVQVAGTAPFRYQWLKSGSPITGATNATLDLLSATAADSADYAVQVSNSVAMVQSDPAHVSVIETPLLSFDPAARDIVVAFPAVPGFVYQLESATQPLGGPWEPGGAVLTDPVGVIWITNSLAAADNRFFRIRKP